MEVRSLKNQGVGSAVLLPEVLDKTPFPILFKVLEAAWVH